MWAAVRERGGVVGREGSREGEQRLGRAGQFSRDGGLGPWQWRRQRHIVGPEVRLVRRGGSWGCSSGGEGRAVGVR